MMLVSDCPKAAERLSAYVDGSLPSEERAAIELHLNTCASCRDGVKRYRAVQSLLDGALGPKALRPDFATETGKRMHAVTSGMLPAILPQDGFDAGPEPHAATLGERVLARLGGVPWWGISISLHLLVLVFFSLITMAIGTKPGDSVVVLTNLERAPKFELNLDVKKEQEALRDILESKHETAATELGSDVKSKVVVPPEVLAEAQLSDHFETINPDRPDTQSAFGNPDAEMFHSATGNDGPAGGGGPGSGEGAMLSDEMIGLGGAGAAGTGGGWGGGNGNGVGIGTGAGHGSFGQRTGGGRKLLVMKHGGSAVTESAVDKALAWLARNQEVDGHWDSKKHGGANGLYEAKPGDGAKQVDVAMTGMALLAFLGAGHTEKVGKYRDNVKRGIYWLIQQQADSGFLSTPQSNYAHAIAGMALSEAAGMGKIAETVVAAQKAIDATTGKGTKVENLSERGGWAYGIPEHDTISGDLSNTGWTIMFLKSARTAGLKVDTQAIAGAIRFLDACENKDGKNANDPYSRHRYSYAADPANKTTWETSRVQISLVGILNRQFLGTPREELQKAVEWAVEKGKVPQNGKWNFQGLYHIYYGTLVTFQQGGDLWKDWNKALKEVLVPSQVVGGANDGSWEPNGTYCEKWGRVGQTALSAMCLEVYYRYLPLYR
ncbi:MAG: zf-HC2 domain-containing protein [Planctomycetes bacterium]|nr:zf-HC2 domain-containing protein [Planctomycetota bacterium]